MAPWGLSGLAALVLAASCTGTEQAVFVAAEVDDVPVAPPIRQGGSGAEAAPSADAGRGRDDAGPSGPPPDAAVVDPGPDPHLDPGVSFVWSETLPGAGTCRGGRYVGSFTCNTETALVVTITGEISVLLSVAPEQQTLPVEEGTVKGTFFLAPDVEGEIDCTTRAFEAVTIDGMDVFTLEAFSATLNGRLDVDTLVIDGDFVMANSLGQECVGTFRLGVAP